MKISIALVSLLVLSIHAQANHWQNTSINEMCTDHSAWAVNVYNDRLGDVPIEVHLDMVDGAMDGIYADYYKKIIKSIYEQPYYVDEESRQMTRDAISRIAKEECVGLSIKLPIGH